ncbi:uncharacterized protein [Prorops nasuta]|uniref:uncharacterized protein n=1 Tax=Prorops nasuta TaxID=863751 RepID=UPI0034CE7B47
MDSDLSTSNSSTSKIFSSSNSSSDSDLPDHPRKKQHRITSFMETVHKYDDEEFKEHFRLNRTTVDLIINIVETEHILPQHTFGRKKICAEKSVLLTLWYLSNTETFRESSDRFDITKSSCHRIISKIVDLLVKKSTQYITWPINNELHKVQSGFYKMQGIKGVVGAIDGCHVKIKKPASKYHYAYYNRKGDYSVLIQGVCDHKKRFISFFCGEPGSIHDSRLLKKSSLYKKGMNGFLNRNFLLGDSAYPCLNWLIPPFKDNGNFISNKKIFNYRHSATRVVIENAFGLLKGRFRRLKFFENDDLKLVTKYDENDDNDDSINIQGVSGINEM